MSEELKWKSSYPVDCGNFICRYGQLENGNYHIDFEEKPGETPPEGLKTETAIFIALQAARKQGAQEARMQVAAEIQQRRQQVESKIILPR